MKRAIVYAIALSVIGLVNVTADVKTQEKSQVQFSGMLGRMFNLFGGKAAKEGIVSTVAVSGSRMARLTDTTGEIIDLGEEKVYDLDLRKKTYTVTTFDEIRRKMREAEEKARKENEKETGKSEPQKEYEVDVVAKESGQRKAIASNDCREVVTTVTVREKGKTLEQGGGMVLTANTWLAPAVPQLKEVTDFNVRYAKQLFGIDPAASAEQMAAALAIYPALKVAMEKFHGQKVNWDGSPLETTVTVQAVKTAEQVAQEQKSDEPKVGGGVGGMLGGLARRGLSRKKDDESAGDKTRQTVMTTTHQVMSISTGVSPADVAIPAGFKQK